jgi:hypothetical protein
MKNKNWIRKISNTYIQLNEEEEIQLQQKPTSMKVGEKVGELTFASIFDENLWQELVNNNPSIGQQEIAGGSTPPSQPQPPSRPKPGPRPSVEDIEPIIIRKKKNQNSGLGIQSVEQQRMF